MARYPEVFDPLGPSWVLHRHIHAWVRAVVPITEFFAPAFVTCAACRGPAELWMRGAGMLEGAPVPRDPDAELLLCCRRCLGRRHLNFAETTAFPAGTCWGPPAPWRKRPRASDKDPFFGCAYWARVDGPRGSLWVVNRKHAKALRDIVRRPHARWTGANFDNVFLDWRQRVPGWMKSRKGRDLALRLIDRAERKLDGIDLG